MRGLALALAASTGLAAVAWSQNDTVISRFNDVFRGDKEAYALWPAQYILGPKVTRAEWSSSGKWILGCRRAQNLTEQTVAMQLLGVHGGAPTAPDDTIFAWSVETGKLTPLWQVDGTMDPNFSWIGRSDTALTMQGTTITNRDGSQSEVAELISIDVAAGRATVLQQATSTKDVVAYIRIVACRSMPYALAFGTTYVSDRTPEAKDSVKEEVVWVIHPGGTMGPAIQLPPGAVSYQAFRIAFKQTTYLAGVMPKRPGQTKRESTWYVLDAAAGTVKACDPPSAPISFQDEDPAPAQEASGGSAHPGLDIKTTYERLGQSGAQRRVRSAWLTAVGAPQEKGRRTSVLVAADCTLALLSPNCDRVLYLGGGSLFWRNIQTIDLAEYQKALDQAEREAAIQNAKEAALALIMYASDYDDVYPGSLPGDLDAYTKDSSILDGFIYTFQGGNMSDIASPAETEMGYIEGPGGRAVAYTDGHVKWIPN